MSGCMHMYIFSTVLEDNRQDRIEPIDSDFAPLVQFDVAIVIRTPVRILLLFLQRSMKPSRHHGDQVHELNSCSAMCGLYSHFVAYLRHLICLNACPSGVHHCHGAGFLGRSRSDSPLGSSRCGRDIA